MKQIINVLIIFIVNLITCKKHIFDLKDSKNILFVRFDNKLGDTVVDTFFIKGLRAQAANAKITLLIRTPYNELLEGNEDINEIITLPNTKYIYAALKMILKLKKNKYDVIIDIPYTLSIKRILFYSILKPKAMVAVNNSNYKFVTHTLQIGDVFQYQQHISELYSLTINMFGNQNYNKGYFLFSRKDIKRSVELFLNDNNIKNEKILFFNTEGSTAERSLSNKKITELLFLINYNFKNLKIILSVFKKNIKIPQNTDIFLYKADSLLGLVEMIKTSNYILTPDTGIVHIADAFNKPMVTLNWEKTPFIFLSKNKQTQKLTAPNKKNINHIDNSLIITSLKNIIY